MYKTILMPELEVLIKQKPLNIIDVREIDEFTMGHISGAMLCPVSEFMNHLPKLSKKKSYYIVCHSGSRSQAVCDYLGKQGYEVTNVMGGMSTYRGIKVTGLK
jgi:rhodanese-related sulfurtransferase